MRSTPRRNTFRLESRSRSPTKVPLLGADGYFALINQTEHVGALEGLHPYRVRHLLDRYGSLISEVLALAADRRDLLNPITAAPGYLKVEAATLPSPRARCIWRTSWPAGRGSRSSTPPRRRLRA